MGSGKGSRTVNIGNLRLDAEIWWVCRDNLQKSSEAVVMAPATVMPHYWQFWRDHTAQRPRQHVESHESKALCFGDRSCVALCFECQGLDASLSFVSWCREPHGVPLLHVTPFSRSDLVTYCSLFVGLYIASSLGISGGVRLSGAARLWGTITHWRHPIDRRSLLLSGCALS